MPGSLKAGAAQLMRGVEGKGTFDVTANRYPGRGEPEGAERGGRAKNPLSIPRKPQLENQPPPPHTAISGSAIFGRSGSDDWIYACWSCESRGY